MSAIFTGSNYLWAATSAIASPPFTFAAWVKLPDTTGDHGIICCGNSGSAEAQALDSSGSGIRAGTRSTSIYTGTAATGLTTDTWHLAVGVWSAVDMRVSYRDATSASNTTSAAATGLNLTAIGAWIRNSVANQMVGRIAEAAIWDQALTSDDVAELLTKAPTLLAKTPTHYWPLLGDADPMIGSMALTNQGGVTFDDTDHPPLTYPSSGAPLLLTLLQSGVHL